jgi:hydrogenase-4 component B
LVIQLYLAGLLAYLFGLAGGAFGRYLTLLGALAELAASVGALASPAEIAYTLPSAIPYLTCSVRLDPLSAFFLLALSILATAVATYSFGYKGPGLNLLLLALTVVFTASNVLFFLIAWELMALAAYLLVVSDHESVEARRGGMLYFLMSRGGTAMLLIGFLLIASQAGTLEFRDLHSAGRSAAAFVLLFLGFGVKAGIIPLHIWLPAAHPVAPSNVSALMSGIVIKAGIYGMARVFFDFYGALPVWAGMLVLAVGVVSALLGVLYALMEHDLKRLLAYHSIENIGIILMGFGAALLFRAFGHPNLAAIALVAGLFHTLNHSVFKCLLFLGAGAVVRATGTRNMEHMGGLIRRMPATALYFLVGAIAISGLPPLNGFVSEWLTYQALLAGFGATSQMTRLAFPMAGALLALTAALAAACFVKAFGITFLALPRTEAAERAHESPLSMQAAMALLSVVCMVLGLGASWIMPVFDPITRHAFGLAATPHLASGMTVTAGSAHAGSVSTFGIALLLVVIGAAPVVVWWWKQRPASATGPTWDCGLPGLTADNEYTATAFSKPLRMIFAALFRPRREIHSDYDVSPYYPKAVRFESEIEPTFEKRFYDPLRDGVLKMAAWMRRLQAGSIHLYLAYVFVTLILLLLFGVRA